MADHDYLTAYHVARHGRAEGDGDTTHVAVPVDEYAALIRARDILANPEQLADDILDAWVDAGFRGARFKPAIVECLRRAAAGTADPGPDA